MMSGSWCILISIKAEQRMRKCAILFCIRLGMCVRHDATEGVAVEMTHQPGERGY